MAHFARLDENNIVQEVIVVNNNVLLDENGNESEAIGIAFCNTLKQGIWIQTSYNANFRKRYAGQGMEYRQDLDAFILSKPYPSWIMNTQTCDWEAPIPYPTDNKPYHWVEDSLSWVLGFGPQPYPSWTMGDDYRWHPPVNVPADGQTYYWNESILNWQLEPV